MSPTSCQTAPPRTRRGANSTSRIEMQQYQGCENSASAQRGDDLARECRSLAVIEGFLGPADTQPVPRIWLGNDMEVHVRDRLVRLGAVVLEDVVFPYPGGGHHRAAQAR